MKFKHCVITKFLKLWCLNLRSFQICSFKSWSLIKNIIRLVLNLKILVFYLLEKTLHYAKTSTTSLRYLLYLVQVIEVIAYICTRYIFNQQDYAKLYTLFKVKPLIKSKFKL